MAKCSYGVAELADEAYAVRILDDLADEHSPVRPHEPALASDNRPTAIQVGLRQARQSQALSPGTAPKQCAALPNCAVP